MAHNIIEVTYTVDQMLRKLFASLKGCELTATNVAVLSKQEPCFSIAADHFSIEKQIKPFLDEVKDGKCLKVEVFRVSKSGQKENIFDVKVADLDLNPRTKKILSAYPDLTVGFMTGMSWRRFKRAFSGLGDKSLVDIQNELENKLGVYWE